MISPSFYDHTVDIWGSAESRGATFREASRSWARVPGQEDVDMAIQARRETVQDGGPGERVVGEYMGYGDVGIDVREGDVIEIITGPEASSNPSKPRLLKVDSVYRPFNRHTELVLIQWDGELS